MRPPRRIAATAASLTTAFSIFFLSTTASQAQGRTGACEDAAGIAVLASPVAAWKGAPLRVVFAAEKPIDGELSLTAPDGRVAARSQKRYGGPPYFWYAEVQSPGAGTWHASLASSGCGTITRVAAPVPSAAVNSSGVPRNCGEVW